MTTAALQEKSETFVVVKAPVAPHCIAAALAVSRGRSKTPRKPNGDHAAPAATAAECEFLEVDFIHKAAIQIVFQKKITLSEKKANRIGGGDSP